MSTQVTQTLSEHLIQLLQTYGVETIFGIPGVHTVDLYRGLQHSRIRHVCARHEQSLGFMADGYARVTGKTGVCFVITGPGVTNILTAMAQAYADSIPMLVISGVNPFGRISSGNGYLHELPHQQQLTQGVCAFSHTITHPNELAQVLARAFAIFDSGRPRPVHIEIPLNLMAAPLSLRPPHVPTRLQAGPAHPQAIAQAARALQSAKRPLIFAGGGAIRAANEVTALAQRLDAPVVMTINARGLLSPNHPLGISASPSFPAVRAMLQDSDLLLAIGTEMGPTDYDCYDTAPFTTSARLIRLDIDAQQIMRNCAPDIALLGDAKTTLQLLLQALSSTDTATQPAPTQVGAQRAQLTRTQAFNELPPVLQADIALLHALRDYAPHALWVGDSTRLVYAGNMGYSASAPHTWFNASVGFGALGYGLPAAIGAAIGTAIGSTHACQSENPQRTVVCLVGDGGFQFTMAEMGTAIEVGARLVVILLNNYGYGEIKAAMQSAGVNPTGVDLHTPDFVRCAQAYGWQAMRIGADIPATQWATLIGSCIANVNTDADEKTKQPMLIELCV